MNIDAPANDALSVSVAGAFESARHVLTDAIAARAFPGCAFGVLSGGKVVLQDAAGDSTYDPDGFRITPQTVYDIASLTKVVATTAAAMLLFQRGILYLETPLGELLPGFVVGRPREQHARLVTIRHLLAHNAGLPGYVELFRTATTPDAMVRACLQLPLEAEPGTRAEYSDIGFILLGKALEVLLREPLAAWVEREIFDPLHLQSTGFNPAVDRRSSIPPTEKDTTLRHRTIQGEVQDENAWRLNEAAGHAGLFSNVPDLLQFAGVVLAGWTESHGQVPFVSRHTLETFSKLQGPAGSSCALGWDTPSQNSSAGQYFSSRSIGHLAYSGCSLWIDLPAGIAVVLLTNRTWPDRGSQLIREVRPAFHDAVRLALDPSATAREGTNPSA